MILKSRKKKKQFFFSAPFCRPCKTERSGIDVFKWKISQSPILRNCRVPKDFGSWCFRNDRWRCNWFGKGWSWMRSSNWALLFCFWNPRFRRFPLLSIRSLVKSSSSALLTCYFSEDFFIFSVPEFAHLSFFHEFSPTFYELKSARKNRKVRKWDSSGEGRVW